METRHLAYAIADAFVEGIRDSHSAAQFAEIRRRNAAELDQGVCHSHDFCDANMIMLEAFTAICGREPAFLEGTDAEGHYSEAAEADAALWSQAWNIAASVGLRAACGEPTPLEKMTAQYEAFVASHGYAAFRGDAEELLLSGTVTSQADAQWLSAFVEQWEDMETAAQRHA